MIKTVYRSDILNKSFETKEEADKAEKEYNEKNALILKKKEERTNRAKEVNSAYEKYMEDYKEYLKLRNEFIKDYGEWHMTYRDGDLKDFDDLDFKPLFKLLRSTFF